MTLVALRAAYKSSTSSPFWGLYANSESTHFPVIAKRKSGSSIACAIACNSLYMKRSTSIAVWPTVWYMKESNSLISVFALRYTLLYEHTRKKVYETYNFMTVLHTLEHVVARVLSTT